MKTTELELPKQAVAVRQTTPPSMLSMTDMAEQLISKAVDSKSAVEVIKELRAMRDEDMRRAAEASFNAAFSIFQASCPVIIKGKSVSTNSGQLAYKYAPIEEIENIIRPLERANNFTHTFDQNVESQPGWVIARCIITHTDTQFGSLSKTTESKFPIGSKTQIMSDTQVYASALTFCNRRTLANAYGLVIAGEDKDGIGPRKNTTSARVVTLEIRNRFFEVTKDIHQKILAFAIDAAWIEPNQTLDDLPDSVIPTTKAELAAFRAKVEAHQ